MAHQDSGKPGRRLWLLKWLVVVALALVLVLLLYPGGQSA
jgi:hypothetical protein